MVKKTKSKRKGRSAAFMRSINPYLRSKKRTIKLKKRGATMKKRRKSSKRSSGLLGNVGGFAAPVIYGAARSRISAYLAPYTSKIPAGAISDEVGLFLAAWAAKKYLFKQKGIIRDALTAGQNIELAMIGEAIASGQLNLGGQSSGTSNGYVFA